MAELNVHIVGAGIVGLATAAAFVERGCAVTIVDREGPAAGASQGNAGAIAWTDVAPLAAPGIWKQALKWLADPLGPLTVRPGYALQILPWMLRFMAASNQKQVGASTVATAALNSTALPSWERLWRRSGTHNQVRRDGCLEVFNQQADLDKTRPSWDEQRRYGIRVDELSGEQLRELEPDLAPEIVGGAMVPDWAQMDDPKVLCLSLADWLQGQGVSFVKAAVTRIEPAGDGAALVLDDGSRVPCDRAVIACGAWSKALARQLGDSIPLDTERGYNITVPEPGVRIGRFIMLPGHGFVLSPQTGGLRIGGAVEFGGLNLSPNWSRVDAMIARAKRIVPGLDASNGTRWMGFRPSLPDSLPVIGPAAASPHVAYAFGHAHHGLTQAATTGELVAELLLGGTPEIDLTPFRATRF